MTGISMPGSPLARSIVLWCPDWPVRAALLQRPELLDTEEHVAAERATGACSDVNPPPIALIEKGLVFACSLAARDSGVHRGLRVREAQSRCPSLVVLPYDPLADARLFEPVLTAVEQLVPGIQPIRPGMLALRARGPARYYGGERQAVEALLGVLADCGVPDARAGVADGPFAAEQAARAASAARPGASAALIVQPGGSPAFLGGLPVEAMADAGFVSLCRRLGLTTLAALAGFGEEELATRFGATGLRVHSLVTGRDVATVVPRSPQRALERSLAFEQGLDRVDQIAFAVRRTADEVVEGLSEARLVCTAVTVTIESETLTPGRAVGAARMESSERTWLHLRWFTAADLVDRVRWQLQGAGSAVGELTSPVVRVVIAPESVDATHHHEEGLWGDAPDERIHHAISRVQSMLGHDAVVTAAIGGGRMLRERQLLVPWGDRLPAQAAARAAQPWPGSLPDPLPATVFPTMLPVAVLTGDGASVEVTERGQLTGEPELFAAAAGARPIRGWAGPWSVEERWWSDDAQAVHRFGVVDADGVAWLLVLDGSSWQAEARYD